MFRMMLLAALIPLSMAGCGSSSPTATLSSPHGSSPMVQVSQPKSVEDALAEVKDSLASFDRAVELLTEGVAKAEEELTVAERELANPRENPPKNTEPPTEDGESLATEVERLKKCVADGRRVLSDQVSERTKLGEAVRALEEEVKLLSPKGESEAADAHRATVRTRIEELASRVSTQRAEVHSTHTSLSKPDKKATKPPVRRRLRR